MTYAALITMALFALLPVWLPLARALFRKPLHLHLWHYRNPYDRECVNCRRHEVRHAWADQAGSGWWEVFCEGDPNAEPCGQALPGGIAKSGAPRHE